jgi:alanyl-tRNA synthetase
MGQAGSYRLARQPGLRCAGHPAVPHQPAPRSVDDLLSSRRTWVCELSEGRGEVPCGGTHVSNIAELSSIIASLTARDVDGGLELSMDTIVDQPAIV